MDFMPMVVLDYPDEEIPESEVELHKSKTINIT